MKKLQAVIAVIVAVAILAVAVQAADVIVVTNVCGTTTLSPTNTVALLPTTPSGYVRVEYGFKVTSGTATVVNVAIAASTNVLSTAGATYVATDGWQKVGPVKADVSNPLAFSRMGTIEGATTVDYWVKYRR